MSWLKHVQMMQDRRFVNEKLHLDLVRWVFMCSGPKMLSRQHFDVCLSDDTVCGTVTLGPLTIIPSK